MDPFSLVFGLVTVVAFIFALYQHFRQQAKERIERAKVQAQVSRIHQACLAVISAAETVNLLIQRSKEPSVSEDELRNLGRVARQQLIFTVRQLENEEDTLAAWQFGRVIMTPARGTPKVEAPSPEHVAE